MGRSPWKDWLLFCAAWGILFLPVRYLTAGGGRQSVFLEQPASTEPHLIHAWASLRFSEAPIWFRISQQGREILRQDGDIDLRTDLDLELDLDGGFAEILLEAEWKGDRTRVAELEIFPDGYRGSKQHVWAENDLEHLLVFSWDGEN